MTDPLKKWYPIWAENAKYSANWLRSIEYIKWHRDRGTVPLNEIDREARAKEYDAKAIMWEQKTNK